MSSCSVGTNTPTHMRPLLSRRNPGLQMHLKLPSSLMQSPLRHMFLIRHSSWSVDEQKQIDGPRNICWWTPTKLWVHKTFLKLLLSNCSQWHSCISQLIAHCQIIACVLHVLSENQCEAKIGIRSAGLKILLMNSQLYKTRSESFYTLSGSGSFMCNKYKRQEKV